MTRGSENGGWAPAEEADRCPICLGVLGRDDAAMPDSCCHVFCIGCLVTWAESQTFPSCPVDRRPFHIIYKWDTTFGCVLVPVKKKTCTSQPEWCCTDKEPSDCLLTSKQEERPQRQNTQRTLHANVKGLVKKCNDDPCVMDKKEVQEALRFSWSLSSCGTGVGARIESISEPLWLTEEVSSLAGHKQCRHQTQDCPWLSALVPISSWGNSRHWSHAPDWNNRHFPPRRLSPFSTSGTSFGFGNFVFQEGRVCAVTCPKGGSKKGGRASGSRAPTKQTESTSRRSGRNSKVLEQAPTQEPGSSPSHSTDSDSSANQSTQPGRSSPVATKRKGKQAANRKSDNKRKGPGRRKASPRVLSSPTPSEEEEEAEEETELREKKGSENCLGSEHSDVEATPEPGQKSFSATNEEQSPTPLFSDAGQEQDKTRSQAVKDEGFDLLEEQEQVEKEKESEEEIQSPPSQTYINSPGMSSESQGEEEHQDPVSCGEMKDHKEMNSSPISSSPEQPLESPQLAHSGQHKEEEQEEDTSVMEVTEVSEEVKAKNEVEANAEMVPTITLKAHGASEENASENTIIHSSQDETSKSSECRTKEDNQSKDDTFAVLMDCDLPCIEHSNNMTVNPQTEGKSPTNVVHLASTSLDMLEERNGGQCELEGSSEKESQDRKNGRQRRSRFHSSTTTWSPKTESRRDSSRRSRSGSREKTREQVGSPPSSYHSRPRSRDRERDSERDSSRRERCRDRKSRKRSRSRSISRSRSRSSSRSRSRTRPHRRGATPEQPSSGAQSPSRRKDRWGGDGWRVGQASGSDCQRNFPEREKSRYENGSFVGTSPDRSRSNNPDWVLEKTREDANARGRETTSTVGNRGEGASDSWSRGGVQGGWAGSERGRGTGQGGYRTSNQQVEQMENRWQPRNTFSGTANNSGSDAYSRFNENRGGRRKEADMGESPLDRSGWSSASSWAVRRTLPADVQSYYSRRERGGGGGGSWTRQEEEKPAADPPKEELAPQVPSEASVPLNVMRPQLNALQYPLGTQGLPVSLQTAAPYGMPPQVPMHLHSTVPLLQVPAVAAQGLPPPPPPPPPMQHGSLMAAQPDSRTTQKLQIQERAVNEVKTAMKPYYQNKDITKEEYKEIVRKAVEKVCHSKSGEVNSGKVANLVKAYVDKYKHARKK